MDVRENEVYASFSLLFTSAVELHQLDVVGLSFRLAPSSVTADGAVDVALDKGSGTAATGAEVDKGIGLKSGAEDGAELCCEE